MIVLDTCAIIWDALDPSQLTRKAKNAIKAADSAHELLISDISLWEISMLVARGRLEIDDTASSFMNIYLQYRSIHIEAICPEIADLAVGFGQAINNDPADRIIAATAINKSARLVTADRKLLGAEVVTTLW